MKSLVDVSFYEFNKLRKALLNEYAETDHAFFETDSSILISAPHGVSQIRLGQFKRAEIGTIPLAMLIAKNTNANIIIKTQNNDDDANFYDESSYRKKIDEIIKSKHIKYLIDFHGMRKSRPCDVNLGVNFGQNIKQDIKLFDSLAAALKKSGFSVQIDQPFCAGPKTIAGSFAKKYNIWAIQLEVNCAITNEPANNQKCNLLINTIIDWLNRNY